MCVVGRGWLGLWVSMMVLGVIFYMGRVESESREVVEGV